MGVHFVTFGCKANQYDTERFRQELEARGIESAKQESEADWFVVNTCTVTNQADAVARKAIRKLEREHPGARIVVAGCSAALRAAEYARMKGVAGVIKGHDPVAVARAIAPDTARLAEADLEPIGQALLARDERGTRAFMKIQDGCDRRCSFCATRLARGRSRSRRPEAIVAEARLLAENHPEIVITGVHIGHYGYDLNERGAKTHTLSKLCARLVEEVPAARFRIGSVEATELDDLMVELLATGGGRIVPHLHVPMQSGADPVLRAMRRWHNRSQYRGRMLAIASRLPYLGLGADVITGFPGETDEDHASTRALIEELPFTYLHVFPYSVRDHTHAASLPDRVPGDVSAERARELRQIAEAKGAAYRRARAGGGAEVVVERGGWGLTEDYLRVRLRGDASKRSASIVWAGLALGTDGELEAAA